MTEENSETKTDEKPTMEPLKYADFFNETSKYTNGNHEASCKECAEKFEMVGILEVHMSKVHKCDPMNFCDECGTGFKRRMGMILHFRQTHMAPDETYGKALGCDICDAFLVINGFSSYDELVDHTESVHGADTFINTPGNAGRSKCPLCTGAFTYRKGMIEHMQVIHGDHLSGKMLQLKGDDKEKFCTDRRFKCQHCDRLFTVRKSLVSHMEKIHKDFTGCKYGTATVNDKQIMFTGKSPRTPVEGKKTPSERKKTPISKYLKDYHIDVSSNTAIQQCPKCPQVFTRKAILDMHIRMSHKSKDTPVVPVAEESLALPATSKEIEVKKEEEPEKEESVEPEKVEIIDSAIKDISEDVQIKEEIIETKVEEEEETVEPPRKRLRKQQSPLVKEVTDDSFYTKEELAVSKLENHHLFFDDDVPCEANTPLEEDRECCPKCDRKFITYFSMMRHVAFAHYPAETARLMKLPAIPRNTKELKAK